MRNVLSLFDGLSGGQIALNRAGIKYEKYYASEIDKHAIKVTTDNYPNTIQLGDITKIDSSKLKDIDLLIGGSPCQGFSFAGKQLNFEDPRSKLFFEYVRLLKELKPKYFLLENVVMKKKHEHIISSYLGVLPVYINSSLVSAQERKRVYWTNIPGDENTLVRNRISQPEDRGILLKDILEDKNNSIGRIIGRKINPLTNKRNDDSKSIKVKQRIEIRNDHKSNCLSTVQKDNIVFIGVSKVYTSYAETAIFKQDKPIYSKYYEIKAAALLVASQNLYKTDFEYRKLTPIECARLQTVPDKYCACVSNAQQYKMLGNGWTIDVIVHILKNLK